MYTLDFEWTTTCQDRIINCDKCSKWWGILIMRETMPVWGLGHTGNLWYLPLNNFAGNLKLL